VSKPVLDEHPELRRLILAAAQPGTSAKFERIDLHGSFASPCTIWGVIIPSG